MSNTQGGGRPPDEFVFQHFSKVEKSTTTKRWSTRCNYCPDTAPVIIHRDGRCIMHLSKVETCPNVPVDVRKAALQILMKKGGIETVDVFNSDSDVEIVEKDDGPYEDANIDGPESISLDELNKEFDALDTSTLDAADGDSHGQDVQLGEVYDLSGLDGIHRGEDITGTEEELGIGTSDGTSECWDPATLLRSLGI